MTLFNAFQNRKKAKMYKLYLIPYSIKQDETDAIAGR